MVVACYLGEQVFEAPIPQRLDMPAGRETTAASSTLLLLWMATTILPVDGRAVDTRLPRFGYGLRR